ncbi:MAG TPA: AglZ/HisF2 family acetamidino modification protein [Pyrinomonadaceae bacterium]|jgi:cyclase
MFRPRVIPVLLLKNSALVKSVGFKNHRYIGDPMNAATIFNDLKADELVLLDTEASKAGRLISPELVRGVGEEVYMPFAVGGGIRSVGDIKAILSAGAEKVVINTHAHRDPDLVREAAETFGSSAVVVCIDVKRRVLRGRRTWVLGGSRPTAFTPVEFARLMEEKGAGELIVQSIDRDGTMAGYDLELVKSVSASVGVPVVALGGAGSEEDLVAAYRDGGANAVAAGSLFVYQGKKRGVLINYPDKNRLTFE